MTRSPGSVQQAVTASFTLFSRVEAVLYNVQAMSRFRDKELSL